MKVLLIDDHAMFRQGMKLLLSDLDESLQFFEAGTIADAMTSLQKNGADLILLDLNMPDGDGLSALREIRASFSAVPLAVVSGDDDPARIRELVDEGAAGYIPKSSSSEILVAALRLVLSGGVYLPPKALDFVAAPNLSIAEARSRAQSLTSRQTAVLLKAIRGIPNKAIAQEMHIAEGTVKSHLSVAFRILGVHNRTEAVFAAAQLGLRPHPFE
jgi:two-component system, NarL family, nitrate/nitrite response regulator NarL